MPDPARSAATASRLIGKNGREVVLEKTNRDAADPAKPWRGPEAEVASSDGGARVTTTACFVPPGSGLGRSSIRRGAETVDAEQVALISAADLPSGTDLSGYDRMIDGDEVWDVLTTEELRPGPKGILWVLGVRR